MRGNSGTEHYRGQLWERVCALVAAGAILAVVLYLLIRDEPFADPNLAVMARILLALVVALFGATAPGFLDISWKGRGLAIRAGGALALFVLTIVATPQVVQQTTHGDLSPAVSDVDGPVIINGR